jgi:type VI secretion system secreted protein VgrG
MNDLFSISSDGLPEGARVVGFRGNEAISKPYVFEIYFTVASEESHELDLGDAVSSKATLTLDRQDGRPPFAFHGILAEVSLIHEMGGRALVRALLVPRLWQLGQTFHSRIFTGMSIPDIIKETLEDGGLSSDEYVFKLVDQYKPEEHVCQYQESHLDFISRWMEREGLYYYFEQEEGQEKLVITDNRASQHELVSTPVRFHALTGSDVSAKECLQTFICRHKSLPGTVRFKDHDYSKPRLKVGGTAPITRGGTGEISVHGARFFTPEAGKRLAMLRAEEMLAREVLFTGSGTSFYLRAGYTFALEDHPRQSFDAKYLAVEVEHQGNQGASTPELRKLTGLDTDEVYRVDVTAIPAPVQFRAELHTAWPRIYGTEHGTIDGEAESEYAQIDEHGRYVVRFAFDESILGNGKASTRVRMMQPHGGGVEGWHFPLRKGTEVLFTFLGGDPDRPVIAGVVPNALTPSAVTSGNHTKNVIQTGGRNRLELEDKAGLQRITLSTPHANTYLRMGSPNGALDGHELILHTGQNALLNAQRQLDVKVGGMMTEEVDGTVEETYHSKVYTTIGQGREETIVAGGMIQDIHGGLTQTIEPGGTQTVTGHWVQKVTGDNHDKYGSWTTDVHDAWVGKFGGHVSLHSDSTIAITSPDSIKITAPELHINATATWYKVTPHSEEAYGFKNAVGAQKGEVCGVALSATGMSISRTGLKIDLVNAKIDNKSLNLESGEIKTSNLACRILSAGITKLG